jgi:urease accessory protein
MVGASLEVMASDAQKMRGARPVRVHQPEDRRGLPAVIGFIEKQGLLDGVAASLHR